MDYGLLKQTYSILIDSTIDIYVYIFYYISFFLKLASDISRMRFDCLYA